MWRVNRRGMWRSFSCWLQSTWAKDGWWLRAMRHRASAELRRVWRAWSQSASWRRQAPAPSPTPLTVAGATGLAELAAQVRCPLFPGTARSPQAAAAIVCNNNNNV